MRTAPLSPARREAFRILIEVGAGRAHADDLLRGRAAAGLSASDRNLLTALVMGVLRWQIRLDAALRPLLARPDARLDPEVQVALRLGAFQLHLLDRIPARAAIDESVELAKQAGHSFAARMVNAVLRRLAALPWVEPASDTPAGIALAEAHPEWLVARWAEHYGLDRARGIARHGQGPHRQTIRLADPAAEAELGAAGIELAAGELLTAARTVISGDLADCAPLHEGRIWIQDEGSQLAAEILGTGTAMLDCCAAPGGKTMILAEGMLAGGDPEATLVAVELDPGRLTRMRARMDGRLARYGGRVQLREGDATALPERDAYDRVLADVPCSGTGTMGRNPEIRHRLTPAELARHRARQQAILASAAGAARPGGRLVYSTCSLEPEENEEVVAGARTCGLRPVGLGERIGQMAGEGRVSPEGAERLRAAVTAEGWLRLLPGTTSHGDGFFVALFERGEQ